MTIWNCYFIIKLSLYFLDLIDLNVWLNLALALALLAPLPTGPWQRLRALVAIPVAILLFYHDTRFPPFQRLTSAIQEFGAANPAYLMDLLSRFVSPSAVFVCAGALLIATLLSRKLRLDRIVLLAIFPLVPLYQYLLLDNARRVPVLAMPSQSDQFASIALPGIPGKPDNAALDQALNAFYKTQAERRVVFPKPGPGPAFDVVILQVCSMAWDDLRLAGLEKSAPMQRFDLLFRQFNTATAYSGPAAIRLLQAPCGQAPHSRLYEPVPSSCFLFEQFANAGFEGQMLLNHDGLFGDMLSEFRRYGGLNMAPMSIQGLPVQDISFDGSSLVNDHVVLKRWLDARQQSTTPRVAMFYNTTSLHDGNHPVGTPSGGNASAGYIARLKRLLTDLDGFFNDLEDSGRKIVVIVVPEHGAGARGDRMQIPFMRENPSPAITLAPVGVRLIGLPRPTTPLDVPQPTSYLDLAALLRDIIQRNPYAKGGPDAQTLASAIGTTPHVAENDGSVVVRWSQDYYIRYKDSAWTEYRFR